MRLIKREIKRKIRLDLKRGKRWWIENVIVIERIGIEIVREIGKRIIESETLETIIRIEEEIRITESKIIIVRETGIVIELLTIIITGALEGEVKKELTTLRIGSESIRGNEFNELTSCKLFIYTQFLRNLSNSKVKHNFIIFKQ